MHCSTNPRHPASTERHHILQPRCGQSWYLVNLPLMGFFNSLLQFYNIGYLIGSCFIMWKLLTRIENCHHQSALAIPNSLPSSTPPPRHPLRSLQIQKPPLVFWGLLVCLQKQRVSCSVSMCIFHLLLQMTTEHEDIMCVQVYWSQIATWVVPHCQIGWCGQHVINSLKLTVGSINQMSFQNKKKILTGSFPAFLLLHATAFTILACSSILRTSFSTSCLFSTFVKLPHLA